MSRKVKDLTKLYNGANDGPLSPTRSRSMSAAVTHHHGHHGTSRHSPGNSPVHAADHREAIVGCVGRTDVIFLRIVYYVNVCEAQKKQGEIKKTDDITDKPWFSDEDFEELAQTLKLANNSFDVCILAQQGSEFFRYCNNYKNACLQVVEVTVYKSGKHEYDEGIMTTMDKRWASQFSVISGPLPSP